MIKKPILPTVTSTGPSANWYWRKASSSSNRRCEVWGPGPEYRFLLLDHVPRLLVLAAQCQVAVRVRCDVYQIAVAGERILNRWAVVLRVRHPRCAEKRNACPKQISHDWFQTLHI